MPQFWLTVRANPLSDSDGTWQFVLESTPGTVLIEAEDEDQGDIHRLHLVALVRGLEAIDGAAHVGLWTTHAYLIRSLQSGLPRWREQSFQWEHYGILQPIRHQSLWRRVDRALQIHQVELCRLQVAALSRLHADSAVREAAGNRLGGWSSLNSHGIPPVVQRRLREPNFAVA